jgi:hypothetical protein
MSDWNEQVFQVLKRAREVSGYQGNSKAAAVIKAPCDMIVSENPDWDKTGSKAASTTQQYQTVVKKYNMGGSSTGEPIYQCGTHDFETRNLKEFNEHISRLDHESGSGSKAASSVSSVDKVKVIADFLNSKHY